MARRAVFLAAAVLLATACGSRRPLDARASDQWIRTYTLAPGGEFQVVGRAGSIQVTPGTGLAIEVHAERTVQTASEALASSMLERVRIEEDVTPDRVVLRDVGLGGVVIGAEVIIDFHVTVPSGVRLRLRSAGGRIEVADVDADALVLSTTNGPIAAKGIRGPIEARAVNGNVTVDLANLDRGPIDIRATNGSINLELPAAANANVEAQTVNGAIEAEGLALDAMGEQSRRKLRARLNAGGAPVELTTTNGNIRLRPRP